MGIQTEFYSVLKHPLLGGMPVENNREIGYEILPSPILPPSWLRPAAPLPGAFFLNARRNNTAKIKAGIPIPGAVGITEVFGARHIETSARSANIQAAYPKRAESQKAEKEARKAMCEKYLAMSVILPSLAWVAVLSLLVAGGYIGISMLRAWLKYISRKDKP